MSVTTPLQPTTTKYEEELQPLQSGVRGSVTPFRSPVNGTQLPQIPLLSPQSYYPGPPHDLNLAGASSFGEDPIHPDDLTRYLLARTKDTVSNINSINFETKQIKGHLGNLRGELSDLDDAIDQLDTKITNISRAIDVPSQINLQKHPTYFLLIIFLFFLVIALWQDVFIRTIAKIFGKRDLGIIISVVVAFVVSAILWIVIAKGGTNLFSVESKL